MSKLFFRTPDGGWRNLASLAAIKKTIRMIQQRPFISAKTTMRLFGEEEEKFTVRWTQEMLQKIGYDSRYAACNPLLTERMKMQRMDFVTSHLH